MLWAFAPLFTPSLCLWCAYRACTPNTEPSVLREWIGCPNGNLAAVMVKTGIAAAGAAAGAAVGAAVGAAALFTALHVSVCNLDVWEIPTSCNVDGAVGT